MLVVMRPAAYLKHIRTVFGQGKIMAQQDGYVVLEAHIGN